jgi:hypothetical protein
MPKYNLIGVGTNAKTVKGDGSEYLSGILYLAPADIVKGLNLCIMAILAGCKLACLYTAGRGAFNNVQESRIRKTVLLRDFPELFYEQLREDLRKFMAYCKKRGIQPVIRLNGTSDWAFYKHIDMAGEFAEIQFYDYTKIPKMAYKKAKGLLPDNYHITLSYSEASLKYADLILKAHKETGVNVAVVFRDKNNIPTEFMGSQVIDGDKDDLRFLDPAGHVVALYAKGKAKKDSSGFVIEPMYFSKTTDSISERRFLRSI